jgi:hypothetical protein
MKRTTFFYVRLFHDGLLGGFFLCFVVRIIGIVTIQLIIGAWFQDHC